MGTRALDVDSSKSRKGICFSCMTVFDEPPACKTRRWNSSIWTHPLAVFFCSHQWSFAAQICEAYGANRYPFPEDPARRRQMMAEVTMRLRELHTTIEAGAQPFRSGTWRLK